MFDHLKQWLPKGTGKSASRRRRAGVSRPLGQMEQLEPRTVLSLSVYGAAAGVHADELGGGMWEGRNPTDFHFEANDRVAAARTQAIINPADIGDGGGVENWSRPNANESYDSQSGQSQFRDQYFAAPTSN